MAARFSIDTDTWWHLRAGQWVWENKSILQTDLFSYTKYGEAWEYPGWLIETIMFMIYQYLGPGGLNILTAIFVALTFFVLWRTIPGNNYLKAFVVVLAATASGVYWAARPYLVTFVLSAVFLFLLEKERECWRGTNTTEMGPKGIEIWILPLLMILWANSHGGFAVGFILYGIYFIGLTFRLGVINIYRHYRNNIGGKHRPVNRLEPPSTIDEPKSGKSRSFLNNLRRWEVFLLMGVLLVVAVSLNPSGPKILFYPFKTVGMGALNMYIEEWQSPNFHELRIQPFLLLLVLTFGAVGASKKRISIIDFLLVTIFGSLSLMAGRNIALFALVAPIVINRHAVACLDAFQKDADWLKTTSESASSMTRNVLHWLLLVLVIGAVLYKTSFVVPKTKNEEYFSEVFPVDAVEFLQKTTFKGNLFNSYNWGGYLIWAFPEQRVFIDGRTDLYEGEIIDQWVTVVQANDGWEEILEKWHVEVILLEPYRPVVEDLSERGWELIYEDQQAIVFQKYRP